MDYLKWIFFTILSVISLQTQANAHLVKAGEATAYWGGFIPVYDSTLWVPENTTLKTLLSDQTPIKLELCYRVSLSKADFIEAANSALPQNLSEELSLAVNRLHQTYQAVNENDCYQLFYSLETGVQLWLNNTLKYQDKTADFKRVYFGIWLGENPLSESVKDALTESLSPS